MILKRFRHIRYGLSVTNHSNIVLDFCQMASLYDKIMITGVELLPILVAMVLLLAGGVTVNADRISFCQSDSPGRAGLLPLPGCRFAGF